MRHNVVNNKFRMKTSHRIATFRNMTVSLIENGKIETTLDKAKVLRGVIEPLITLAKRGDVAARRLALQKLPNAESVRKLFHEIAPVFKDRNGGYTRVLKTGITLHPPHSAPLPPAAGASWHSAGGTRPSSP